MTQIILMEIQSESLRKSLGKEETTMTNKKRGKESKRYTTAFGIPVAEE